MPAAGAADPAEARQTKPSDRPGFPWPRAGVLLWGFVRRVLFGLPAPSRAGPAPPLPRALPLPSAQRAPLDSIH